VKQHLGRQAGVQNVEVSLRDGKVDITPKGDAHIDPAQLLKATYDSGVSVAEFDLLVRGKVVKEASGNLSLQVSTNQSFVLVPNDLSRELAGQAGTTTQVTLRGELYRKAAGKSNKLDSSAPLKLLILEIDKLE
jgi:hypothetical protein